MHYKYKYTYRLQLHEWKKYIYRANSKINKVDMVILIPDTAELRTKNQEIEGISQ